MRNRDFLVSAKIRVRQRIINIYRYSELLTGLTRKELKVKYKNSILGFAWSLLNPLLYLLVFWLVFDKILPKWNCRAIPSAT